MNILAVTPIFPWPLHGGPSIRIYNILKGLAEAGHTITLVSGIESGQDPDVTQVGDLVDEVHPYGVRRTNPWMARVTSLFSTHPYPAQRFVTRELRGLISDVLDRGSWDLILVNFLYMVDALPGEAARIPVVLDQHESEEMLWEGVAENGSLVESLFARLMLSKIPDERRRALRLVDAILAVSQLEARDLRTRMEDAVPVHVVPNGVDLSKFEPQDTNGNQRFVFVAGMGVRRNVDAAAWFAEEIFPRIRRACPGAEFLLVGANPTGRAKALGNSPGITVTGTVADVRPYYGAAACVVLPYRFGAGTKLKLLEAMALSRPIITTSKGCHGVPLVDGEHAVIRDDPARFAEAGVQLLSETEVARQLGLNARQMVEQRFSWRKISSKLNDILADIVGEAGRDGA